MVQRECWWCLCESAGGVYLRECWWCLSKSVCGVYVREWWCRESNGGVYVRVLVVFI